MGAVTRAVRRVDPVCFALVMATGIVSAALREAGLRDLAGALLGIAVVCFVILTAASGWRAALFPADLRAGLDRPDQAFTLFAFVAACSVLGNGLTSAGYRAAAAVLAGGALTAWLALAWLIPARVAAWSRARRPIAAVNGTWYLAAVGTQSLAIAAVFLRQDGLLAARLATAVAITAWSAGVALYLVIMVVVVARLLLAGLGPADARAPYWVAMGAASISAFAAAQILSLPGTAAAPGARSAVTVVAVCLWGIATGLIPALIALTAAGHPRPPPWPRYAPTAWVVVFPLGMYAAAGLQLGTAARLPWMHRAGAIAVWPAAAAWVLIFTLMAISPLMGNHHEEIQVPDPGHAGPSPRQRRGASPPRPDLPDGGPGPPSRDARPQDVQRPGHQRRGQPAAARRHGQRHGDSARRRRRRLPRPR
jgi:tellurite resistance protein TehA-like permease